MTKRQSTPQIDGDDDRRGDDNMTEKDDDKAAAVALPAAPHNGHEEEPAEHQGKHKKYSALNDSDNSPSCAQEMIATTVSQRDEANHYPLTSSSVIRTQHDEETNKYLRGGCHNRLPDVDESHGFHIMLDHEFKIVSVGNELQKEFDKKGVHIKNDTSGDSRPPPSLIGERTDDWEIFYSGGDDGTGGDGGDEEAKKERESPSKEVVVPWNFDILKQYEGAGVELTFLGSRRVIMLVPQPSQQQRQVVLPVPPQIDATDVDAVHSPSSMMLTAAAVVNSSGTNQHATAPETAVGAIAGPSDIATFVTASASASASAGATTTIAMMFEEVFAFRGSIRVISQVSSNNNNDDGLDGGSGCNCSSSLKDKETRASSNVTRNTAGAAATPAVFIIITATKIEEHSCWERVCSFKPSGTSSSSIPLSPWGEESGDGVGGGGGGGWLKSPSYLMPSPSVFAAAAAASPLLLVPMNRCQGGGNGTDVRGNYFTDRSPSCMMTLRGSPSVSADPADKLATIATTNAGTMEKEEGMVMFRILLVESQRMSRRMHVKLLTSIQPKLFTVDDEAVNACETYEKVVTSMKPLLSTYATSTQQPAVAAVADSYISIVPGSSNSNSNSSNSLSAYDAILIDDDILFDASSDYNSKVTPPCAAATNAGNNPRPSLAESIHALGFTGMIICLKGDNGLSFASSSTTAAAAGASTATDSESSSATAAAIGAPDKPPPIKQDCCTCADSTMTKPVDPRKLEMLIRTHKNDTARLSDRNDSSPRSTATCGSVSPSSSSTSTTTTSNSSSSSLSSSSFQIGGRNRPEHEPLPLPFLLPSSVVLGDKGCDGIAASKQAGAFANNLGSGQVDKVIADESRSDSRCGRSCLLHGRRPLHPALLDQMSTSVVTKEKGTSLVVPYAPQAGPPPTLLQQVCSPKGKSASVFSAVLATPLQSLVRNFSAAVAVVAREHGGGERGGKSIIRSKKSSQCTLVAEELPPLEHPPLVAPVVVATMTMSASGVGGPPQEGMKSYDNSCPSAAARRDLDICRGVLYSGGGGGGKEGGAVGAALRLLPKQPAAAQVVLGSGVENVAGGTASKEIDRRDTDFAALPVPFSPTVTAAAAATAAVVWGGVTLKTLRGRVGRGCRGAVTVVPLDRCNRQSSPFFSNEKSPPSRTSSRIYPAPIIVLQTQKTTGTTTRLAGRTSSAAAAEERGGEEEEEEEGEVVRRGSGQREYQEEEMILMSPHILSPKHKSSSTATKTDKNKDEVGTLLPLKGRGGGGEGGGGRRGMMALSPVVLVPLVREGGGGGGSSSLSSPTDGKRFSAIWSAVTLAAKNNLIINSTAATVPVGGAGGAANTTTIRIAPHPVAVLPSSSPPLVVVAPRHGGYRECNVEYKEGGGAVSGGDVRNESYRDADTAADAADTTTKKARGGAAVAMTVPATAASSWRGGIVV